MYIGTKQGDILVIDVQGNPVTRVQLAKDVPIANLTWNCEKFNMEVKLIFFLKKARHKKTLDVIKSFLLKYPSHFLNMNKKIWIV